jgi:hypothetical protein
MPFEKVARSLNRGLAMAGGILPRLLLAILKLNLAALFLWYAVDLLSELCRWHYGWMLVVDTISLIALIGFCAAVFVSEFLAEWGRRPSTFRGIGIGPFLLLILIPIVIVGAIGQWHPDAKPFQSDLLNFTVSQTRALVNKARGME